MLLSPSMTLSSLSVVLTLTHSFYTTNLAMAVSSRSNATMLLMLYLLSI